MNQGIKGVCTKAGILMLAFLLCLPCSLKRTLKQELQLPAATHTQHNQERPCPVTIRESGPCYAATTAVKKNDKTIHFFIAAYTAYKTHPRFSALPLQLVNKAVPLYIRYEQYLI